MAIAIYLRVCVCVCVYFLGRLFDTSVRSGKVAKRFAATVLGGRILEAMHNRIVSKSDNGY